MNFFASTDTAYDTLLTAVSSSSEISNLTRSLAEYDEMETFRDSLLLKEHSFGQNYAHLYFVRLIKLRPPVLAAATARWDGIQGSPQYVDKVLDIQQGQLCYIIGTLYMDMLLKPNILEDISKENWVAIPPARSKYIGDKDRASLEDESGRIVLTGARLKKEILVTGVIMGILGSETKSGEFEVLDICLPNLAPQSPFFPMETDDKPAKFVALVSGLNIGNHAARMLELQLLEEYLTGELGAEQDQKFSSTISRVIIAGNSLAPPKIVDEAKKHRKYGYDSAAYDASPAQELDSILQDLCATVDVDLMPGKDDPAMVHMPQQPIHRAIFSYARRCSTFRSVTNPYWCGVEGVTFLGSSGQTVEDMFKYVEGEDCLQLAEQTLFWRHIAPSAPDTLHCYPFQDRDPFIMTQVPNVYFIGNQRQFATSVVEGAEGQRTRVILVPSFSETATIVLVNLTTLECHPVSFRSSLAASTVTNGGGDHAEPSFT